MDKTTNSSTPGPDTRPSPENFQPRAPSIKASAKPKLESTNLRSTKSQSESADPKLSNKRKLNTADSKPSAKPANAKPSIRPKPGAAIREPGTAKVKPKPSVTRTVKPDATNAKPGAAVPKSSAKPEPGTAKVKPGVTSPNLKTSAAKPKPRAKVQPGAANPEPSASNVKRDATNAKTSAVKTSGITNPISSATTKSASVQIGKAAAYSGWLHTDADIVCRRDPSKSDCEHRSS